MTYTLLLIEDNPADADLVTELLAQDNNYDLVYEDNLEHACSRLKRQYVDVILLDLQLPDGSGVASVQAIRAVSGETPVIVLTGTDDEQLALACIDAGAQDYLSKQDLRPVSLRRALGYAMNRVREGQLRELQQTIDHMRDLSTAASQTPTTARLSGNSAVRDRYDADFRQQTEKYSEILQDYLSSLIVRHEKPRDRMEHIVTWLGDCGAGPRDLMDIHVAALDRAVFDARPERGQALAIEGRLFAIEMMGLLVDYYRVGLRRRLP